MRADKSRTMGAYMKHWHVIMGAALLYGEDDELLPAKRNMFIEWVDETQKMWNQKLVA